MATNTGTGTMPDGTRIVVEVEPAPPSPERIADLSLLFGLAVGALVVVWGVKMLMNLFSVPPQDD